MSGSRFDPEALKAKGAGALCQLAWCSTAAELQGIQKENVAPGPSSLGIARRRPSWFSMMVRLIESPMPIPQLFVV